MLREINNYYQDMSSFRIEAWGPISITNTVVIVSNKTISKQKMSKESEEKEGPSESV